MKKKKFTSIPLKFKKTNVANLQHVKGRGPNLSDQSACCTRPDECPTVTTRPDSFKPKM